MKKNLIFALFLLLLLPLHYAPTEGLDAAITVTPIKKRLLLITGCARSGTTYISVLLKECGLDIAHERDGTDGVSSWLMAVESTRTPWGPGSLGYEFEHIFHQVRDPLKTISSASNEPPKSWEYIMKFVPQISMKDSKMVRGAKYWYYWNLLAEEKAEWTYRVEDIQQVLPEMSLRLGIYLPPEAIDHIPTTVNSRNYKNEYTWADLKRELSPELYFNIQFLAHKYGYSTSD